MRIKFAQESAGVGEKKAGAALNGGTALGSKRLTGERAVNYLSIA